MAMSDQPNVMNGFVTFALSSHGSTKDFEQKPGTVSSRRPGITRQRVGCLTCRYRRKKCDNTYPICGHCRRLHLVCKRENPRDLFPEESQAAGSDPSSYGSSNLHAIRPGQSSIAISRAPDTSRLGDYLGSDSGPGKRRMLTYYTQVLAGLLTTNHDNNSFLSVFLPMAMDSPPLQKSLVAWSSAHLACYSKEHLVTFFNHRSSALSMMAAKIVSLRGSLPEAEVTLATCLVLCSMEIAFGDTRDWYHHLVGAYKVIKTTSRIGIGGALLEGPQCFAHSADGKWLLRNFAYHDILGSLTSNKPPLISGRYWLSDEVCIVDCYMGYSAEILAIISEICVLDPEREDDFWGVAKELEKRLRQWKCLEKVDSCLVHLAESHRSTALIALFRKQQSRCWESTGEEYERLPDLKQRIAEEVQKTLEHIKEVPIGSLPESGTLFPLFIAGGEASSREHIKFIRLRLRAFLEFRHFGNIARAIEVLEDLWRLRCSGVKGPRDREVDWMDLLEAKNWKLMLS